MFIGEITDMEVLSDIPSLTYEYYQNNIKPKPQAVGQTEDGQTIWRCRICGYEYVGEELPDDFICPLCKHPASDFEKVVKKTEVKEMAANKYAGTQTEKNLQEESVIQRKIWQQLLRAKIMSGQICMKDLLKQLRKKVFLNLQQNSEP